MKSLPRYNQQRGIVLFIALIALLVISLAAVALIRSVDTSTLIAGNLAFKQSATNGGEGALLRATQWIESKAAVDPSVELNADSLGNGYYATSTALATANGYAATMSSYQMLTSDATWAANKSQVAQINCNGVVSDTDCGGNQIRYVIERMCSLSGAAVGALAPANQQCLFGPISDSTSSQNVKDATNADGLTTSSGAPMYRVTARVIGPKNTVSYIQSFVY